MKIVQQLLAIAALIGVTNVEARPKHVAVPTRTYQNQIQGVYMEARTLSRKERQKRFQTYARTFDADNNLITPIELILVNQTSETKFITQLSSHVPLLDAQAVIRLSQPSKARAFLFGSVYAMLSSLAFGPAIGIMSGWIVGFSDWTFSSAYANPTNVFAGALFAHGSSTLVKAPIGEYYFASSPHETGVTTDLVFESPLELQPGQQHVVYLFTSDNKALHETFAFTAGVASF